jgi:hypothetical protein
MSDTDDYPEELGERRLCWLCVTDYLMDRIAEEGEQGACHYCGVQGPTISIAAFADQVEMVFEHYYERTPATMLHGSCQKTAFSMT